MNDLMENLTQIQMSTSSNITILISKLSLHSEGSYFESPFFERFQNYTQKYTPDEQNWGGLPTTYVSVRLALLLDKKMWYRLG